MDGPGAKVSRLPTPKAFFFGSIVESVRGGSSLPGGRGGRRGQYFAAAAVARVNTGIDRYVSGRCSFDELRRPRCYVRSGPQPVCVLVVGCYIQRDSISTCHAIKLCSFIQWVRQIFYICAD